MASELKKLEKADAAEIAKSESEIADLVKSQEFEQARAAVDLAGLADPTPISDGISMSMSIAAGDWLDAGLSAISMIPYLGDAIGKTAKGAKLARKLAKIRKRLAALTKKVEALKRASRKSAVARAIKKRADDAARRLNCKTCTKPSSRFGTRLPRRGTWKGEKGNSRWTSGDGVSIDYKNGYPDFSTSRPRSLEGEVKIKMTGDDNADFKAARDAMRKKLGDDKWPGGNRKAPEGFTWHHSEDGTTMELVSTAVHDKVPHTGGASLVNDPVY